MQKTFIIGLVVLVVGAVTYVLLTNGKEEPAAPVVSQEQPFDGRNATITIEGTSVSLVDGVSEVPATSDSATKIVTRYFGNEAQGDLNGDGQTDMAFLVSQDRGGSGLFYYVVVAERTADGYRLTDAFLVGDRIAPQSTYVLAGDPSELQVNFAERKPGEPMTAQPSVGVTLSLRVTSEGVLEENPSE